jgi:hypothetical protein
MEVTGQLQASFTFSYGQSRWYFMHAGLGGAKICSGCFGEEGNPFALHCPFLSLVAVWTDLSRLPDWWHMNVILHTFRVMFVILRALLLNCIRLKRSCPVLTVLWINGYVLWQMITLYQIIFFYCWVVLHVIRNFLFQSNRVLCECRGQLLFLSCLWQVQYTWFSYSSWWVEVLKCKVASLLVTAVCS